MSVTRALIKQRNEEAEKKQTKPEPKIELEKTDNTELKAEIAKETRRNADKDQKRYANKKLSRHDIIQAGDGYSDIFYNAFMSTRDTWKSVSGVTYTNDKVSVRVLDEEKVLIEFDNKEMRDLANHCLDSARSEENSHVFAENIDASVKSVVIHPEFVQWLCTLDVWPPAFDAAVAKELELKNNS